MEGDHAKYQCSRTKSVKVVPAWYQFTVGINDVVLNEFISFEIKIIWQIVEEFGAVLGL